MIQGVFRVFVPEGADLINHLLSGGSHITTLELNQLQRQSGGFSAHGNHQIKGAEVHRAFFPEGADLINHLLSGGSHTTLSSLQADHLRVCIDRAHVVLQERSTAIFVWGEQDLSWLAILLILENMFMLQHGMK